jgi:hypothetical protein
MVSNIILWLAVLCVLLAFTAIRMVQVAKQADQRDPRLPREFEFEHECDAHYPRVRD